MDLLPTVYSHRTTYTIENNNNNNNNTINDSSHNNNDNTINSIEYQHNQYELHQQSNRLINQTKLFRQLSAIPNPLYHYLHLFYINRVLTRRNTIARTLHEIVQIAQDILHEVELQEPRFISTLKVINTNSRNHLEQKHDDDTDDNRLFCNNNNNHHNVANTSNSTTTQHVISNLTTMNGTSMTTTATTTTTTTANTNTTNTSVNSSNNDCLQNGVYYDGLRVLSSNHFEITLFLNQMGVFNFMDDGSVPGGAVLKLSDGRKRSMSLWVEFITASGYLSARKIRARFHSLVGQALHKSTYRGIVKMLNHTSEVKLCIRDKYILQITPGFRCNGLWPRSANHWPTTNHNQTELIHSTNSIKWPSNQLINEVKYEGFCLLSQESVYTKDKQASVEGDAWLLDFYDAEEHLLLSHTIRRQCFSILKTLADRHLTGNDIDNNLKHFKSSSSSSSSMSTSLNTMKSVIQEYDIKTLVLHECEKHPNDEDWTQFTLGDRINGILLQLISCLQHRRCPHYFLPNLDIFRGYSTLGMDITAKQTWRLLRELLTCPNALEYL
ncbi:putative nucleotidyltransferase MAB21L1 [Schistosoma japonicum]|uniref:Putative nucleotidyltransferase MAB21L1 n=1 Tax=Schistosoma japonicum TaxID=6182 RepID=A0A4Z2DR26_SCHJA|nr:putative nucleotidyltransferase MAB21L1 [Schistosoma japonicum]